MKIYIETNSYDIWWGIYGLSYKTGWEDVNIFDQDNNKIGYFCLNTKAYLRHSLNCINIKDEEDRVFKKLTEEYLTDDKCHFWYCYDQKSDEDFYEVPYEAPKNQFGIKPSYIELWHPDEAIDLSTLFDAVKIFITKFLKIDEEKYDLEIKDQIPIDEAISSFKEHMEIFGNSDIPIAFSDELIEDLSQKLNLTKEEVRELLQKQTK